MPETRPMSGLAHTQHEPSPAGLRDGLARSGGQVAPTDDLPGTLALVLRGLTANQHAQGGALYLHRGGQLDFVAARLADSNLGGIGRELLDQKLAPAPGSLVAFVGRTGRTMAVSKIGATPGGPLGIDRDFDAVTGCRTESALAVRLQTPAGRGVGVLKLINRLSPGGKVLAFPPTGYEDLHVLASLAAVAIDRSLASDEMRWKHMETILRLSAAAELRDGDVTEHVRRISRLSALVAKAMGLSYGETDTVRYASPMHDIGKTRMPDAVLGKDGPLSDEAGRILRRHTLIGAQILDGLPGEVMTAARDVALTHHERWDGGGYPHGRRGEEIPLPGRIVAVADAFDAMVTRRPYRQPQSIDMALEIVRTEREKQFDPDAARALILAEDQVHTLYET